jgi:hypothetical protein
MSRSARLLVNPTARSVVNRRIMSWWPWNRRASRSPSFAAGVGALVVGDALGDRAAVPGVDLGQLVLAEAGPAGGAGCGDLPVGTDEHVGHGLGPELTVGVPPPRGPGRPSAVCQ